MKTRTKLIGRNPCHEVEITVSVRTNQPGMSTKLTHYEHRQRDDQAVNAVHDALREIFNVRQIKTK